MTAPICVQCQISMVMSRTGIDCELMACEMPYQIWSGDEWRCPSCEIRIIAGFGHLPVAEHFQKKYAKFQAGVELRFWGSLKDKADAGKT